jgi:hypothetical protein
MKPTQQPMKTKYGTLVFYYHKKNKCNYQARSYRYCLNRVIATIHIITHKQIIRIWTLVNNKE